MRVSIVTVSFNQAEFLPACLDSVLGQDYPDLEYLVLDGGSTDGSVDLIRARESRLAYWTSGPDGGAAAALNAGFRRATGEIFAYLNSDDVLLPGAVSAWVDAFRRDPRASVVYGDMDIVGPKGEPATLPDRWVTRFKAFQGTARDLAAGACVIPQQSSAWTRAIFEKVGGFVDSNRTCWDGEFFADIAMAGGLYRHIPRTLAQFRIHGDSISGANKYVEARRIDHARIAKKWAESGFTLSKPEIQFRRFRGRAIRAVRGLLPG